MSQEARRCSVSPGRAPGCLTLSCNDPKPPCYCERSAEMVEDCVARRLCGDSWASASPLKMTQPGCVKHVEPDSLTALNVRRGPARRRSRSRLGGAWDLQMAMMADAADEEIRILRRFDKSQMDMSAAQTCLTTFAQRLHVLFVQKTATSSGYTQHASRQH